MIHAEPRTRCRNRSAAGNLLAGEPRLRARLETTYTIVVDAVVVGAARLEPLAGSVDGAVEVGIWLARDARRTGVGHAAMTALLERARADGVIRVVAETTGDNAGAVALLRRLGTRVDGETDADPATDAVHAELRLD